MSFEGEKKTEKGSSRSSVNGRTKGEGKLNLLLFTHLLKRSGHELKSREILLRRDVVEYEVQKLDGEARDGGREGGLNSKVEKAAVLDFDGSRK